MNSQRILNVIASLPSKLGDLMPKIEFLGIETQVYDSAAGVMVRSRASKFGRAAVDKFTDDEVDQFGITMTDIKLTVIMNDQSDIASTDKAVWLGSEYNILKVQPIYAGANVAAHTLMLRK